jgi:hypothetical protein
MRISGEVCHAHTARRLTEEADVPAMLVGRAHRRVRDAAQEGRRWTDVDAWSPEERSALGLVMEQLRRDGFTVRRRRWPLRWIVAGLVIPW